MHRPSYKENNISFVIKKIFFILIIGLSIYIAPPLIYSQARRDKTDQAVLLIERIFRFLQNNYVDEIDPNVLLEGALRGMIDSLNDPFSAYLDEPALQDLNDTTQGEFGGVGMYIGKEVRENGDELGYIEVIAPIEDTPAYNAGIEIGDLITKIEEEDTEQFTIEEAVQKLRGQPNTPVNITIRRGELILPEIQLTRTIIQVPSVKSAVFPDTKIGYLRIINFTPFTPGRVTESLLAFNAQNVESIIIDLRSNPGGLLSSVISTVDLFFDDELIVGTQGRYESENQNFIGRPGKIVDEDIEIIIMIDKGSASASEIMAGAFQDHERATIVGTVSYGKGSVQQIREIGGAGIRLTISRYFTPHKTFIDKKGITPDIMYEVETISDAEREVYINLQQDSRIEDFVAQNGDATEREIANFASSLIESGIELDARYIRRLVRLQVHRANNDLTPTYDLDFDRWLVQTIEMLQ